MARRKPRQPSTARAARATRVVGARPRRLTPQTPAASFRYIESSALLAALLEQDVSALDALRAEGQRVTSAVTFAEASRALIRARVAGRLTPDQERGALRALRTFERRCAVMAVTDAILTRAGRPFPVEPMRTLDAIHVATAELLGEPPQLVTVITRDARVRDNAQALGYAIA